MTPLQEEIYKILVVVDRFCENHNIPYFMTGGTALGAIRHKGFIPWDDDADIIMLRPYYERFLKLCKTELPEGFVLQHYSVDKSTYVTYAKILNKQTRMRYPIYGLQTIGHVYLDIFPMDGVPKNIFIRRVQLASLRLIQKLFDAQCFKHVSPHWLIKIVNWFVRPVLHAHALAKLFDWVSTWEKGSETKEVWQAGGPYTAEQKTFLRKWVAQCRRAQFEKGEFWIASEAEKCLEKTYGDYMTPPPIEKRINVHNCELLTYENT